MWPAALPRELTMEFDRVLCVVGKDSALAVCILLSLEGAGALAAILDSPVVALLLACRLEELVCSGLTTVVGLLIPVLPPNDVLRWRLPEPSDGFKPYRPRLSPGRSFALLAVAFSLRATLARERSTSFVDELLTP